MADGFIGLLPDGGGKKVDNDVVTTSSGVVYRQRISIASPSDGGTLCEVSSAPTGAEPGLLVRNIHPPLVGAVASLVDVAASGTAQAFSSLARGPVGIMVTVHPLSTGIVRVSGSDVATNKGTPLAAGGWILLQVANANQIHFILEAAGTANLSATAV